MKRAAIAAVILLGLAGAAAAAARKPYMPSSGWSRGESAQFYEDWFGGQLRAMKEPALSSPGSRTGFRRRFRMLVLPSFDHAYAIRVDEPVSGPATVRAVRLDGRGGYAPGKILEQESYVPDHAALERLRLAIDGVRLADLPRDAVIKKDADDGLIVVCADGVRFVFELVDAHGTHVVTRGCDIDPGLWTLVDAADALRRTVGSDLAEYR